uniref:Secreted protein n=1 Tax=Rhizophora mucronata TaxID=61149 RepID=A0A2P2MJA6_RHIMU
MVCILCALWYLLSRQRINSHWLSNAYISFRFDIMCRMLALSSIMNHDLIVDTDASKLGYFYLDGRLFPSGFPEHCLKKSLILLLQYLTPCVSAVLPTL